MDTSIGGVKVHAKGRCLFYFIFLKKKKALFFIIKKGLFLIIKKGITDATMHMVGTVIK